LKTQVVRVHRLQQEELDVLENILTIYELSVNYFKEEIPGTL